MILVPWTLPYCLQLWLPGTEAGDVIGQSMLDSGQGIPPGLGPAYQVAGSANIDGYTGKMEFYQWISFTVTVPGIYSIRYKPQN